MKLFIKHSVFRFVVTVLAASLSQKWWVLIKLLTEDSKFLDGRAVLYCVCMAPNRIRVKIRFSKFLTFFLLFTLLVTSININPSKNITGGIHSFAGI